MSVSSLLLWAERIGLTGGYRLGISRGEISDVVDRDNGHVRCSRIYPVEPDRAWMPSEGAEYYLHFVNAGDAYRQVRRLPEALQAHVYFSIGASSLIVLTDELVNVEAAKASLVESISHETWKVDASGVVEVVDLKCPEHDREKPANRLIHVAGLPNDVAERIADISVYLSNLWDYSCYYYRDIRKCYDSLVLSLNEIIGELGYLLDASDVPPSIYTDSDIKLYSSDPVAQQARVNMLVDQLVQVDSALPYAISQAFYGTTPILGSEPLVANNSLLGISTAHVALRKFTAYVEMVFHRAPIVNVLLKKYSEKEGVNFKDPTAWSGYPLDLNALVQEVEREAQTSKLAFFSGRLGFGEARYNVTTAVQCLHASDTVRWNLLTLSHELMHAHVSGLLAAIFWSESNDDPEVRNYLSHVDDYQLAAGDPSGRRENDTLIESLRNGVFYFCSLFCAYGEIAANPTIADMDEKHKCIVRVLAKKGIKQWELLSEAHLLLNEVMVHILDIKYFYAGNEELFIDSLWQSWATVPGVVEDVHFYLLRSLISTGWNETGSIVSSRFPTAVRHHLERLQLLSDANPEVGLYHKAIKTLRNAEELEQLQLLFLPGCYIASLVDKFLYCEDVQVLLEGNDPLVQDDDGVKRYRINDLCFEGKAINNPVAFVKDRLIRSLDNSVDQTMEHYRSSWLFLALASASGRIIEDGE